MAKHRILVKCVVNYGSEYLLLKKWYDDRIDDPFQWEFADGEVEFGESPERAAERIVAESSGFSVVSSSSGAGAAPPPPPPPAAPAFSAELFSLLSP